MKKLLSVLLVALTMFAFCACNNSSNNFNNEDFIIIDNESSNLSNSSTETSPSSVDNKNYSSNSTYTSNASENEEYYSSKTYNETNEENENLSEDSGMAYRTPTGKRYHFDPDCGGKNSYLVTFDEAIEAGLTPCKKCAS